MFKRFVLEEIEGCPCCNGVFLSPYPIRLCVDHEGKTDIFTHIKEPNNETESPTE